MPTVFGPFPGPRQDHFGNARDWSSSTSVTASIKFKTSRTLLQGLLPPSRFRFAVADTNCYATFSLSSLDNLEWLGGRGYNHFGLYIHGVEYTRENGDKVTGTYLPILFENLPDPIISGREELGMPKVFASLDVSRDSDTWTLQAGWMGNNFLDVSLSGLGAKPTSNGVQSSGPPQAAQEQGLLFSKYVPRTASEGSKERGQADVDYVAFVPNEAEAEALRQVKSTVVAERADIKFDALDWKRLPTLHHIVERLAEIPIYEVVEAQIVESLGGSGVQGARKLV